MKKINVIVFVESVSYRNTSYYGNPSYWVTFKTAEGEYITGYTGVDHACGYGCKNYVGKACRMTYHHTRSGNTIIDNMLKA